jgi:2Fe-2S ferredoxin
VDGDGAAVKNNVPGIEAECGGACACATCHVYVEDPWMDVVGAPQPMEATCSTSPRSPLEFPAVLPDQGKPELDGLVVRTPEQQG